MEEKDLIAEEEASFITLTDENGVEAEFEFMECIEYQGKEYIVLLPADENSAEVVILEVVPVDEENENYLYAKMLCSDDMWPISDIVNRLIHDEAAAREYLCDKFFHPRVKASVVLCSRIRSGKFIHFQMTRAFNGGMDAYIVFRTSKTRSAVIIRFCYK